MAVYVVTGAAGFIGSHLVERLVADGHTVRAIDNFSTGKRENLKPFERDLEIVTFDVALDTGLDGLFRGVDYVLHQAAIPSVPRSIQDPLPSHLANATGTMNVLIAARNAGVRRVVFASSSSLYGDSPTLPKVETMCPQPKSPYASQKLLGEMYCRQFSAWLGLETVSLRYFNVFGPRQDASSQYSGVIAKFITAVLTDRTPVIYGDGEQSRDFTYVTNVVDANLLASTAKGIAGEYFNVACGDRISLNELLASVNRLAGKKLQPAFEPDRQGDVKHSLADISKARDLLGYAPKAAFDDGLRATIEWYQGQLVAPAAR